jgi:hypothetical protein
MASLGVLRFGPAAKQARMWLLTSVLVGALPILFSLISDMDRHQKPDLAEILASGDALVLAAALAGGCLYDLMNQPPAVGDVEDTRKLLIVLSFIAGFVAALWFGDMKNSGPDNAHHVSIYTLWYLVATVVICIKALTLPGAVVSE